MAHFKINQIFKEVLRNLFCTQCFSGESRTCRATESCASPLCGRLCNSIRALWQLECERGTWEVGAWVSFWSEGPCNSPPSQQPTESPRKGVPSLGILWVWESSKWMSPKCQTEPSTIKFCFASAFLATRSHFLVLAPHTTGEHKTALLTPTLGVWTAGYDTSVATQTCILLASKYAAYL